MPNYASHVSTKRTPQSEPIPGRTMIRNAAGGFSFPVDDWVRLDRWLVLGCAEGSYYATERQMTKENAEVVLRCMAANPKRTLDTIVQVSEEGRAPKNSPAIFALALMAANGSQDVKKAIYVEGAVPRVCRTGTHFLEFVSALKQLRGTGSTFRKLVGQWYDVQAQDKLAFQVSKYRQRGGFSHRDALRLSHYTSADGSKDAVLRWAVGGSFDGPRIVSRKGKADSAYAEIPSESLPQILRVHDELKAATDRAEVIRIISEHNVPREFLEGSHSAMLNDPDIWEAMPPRMPLHAMVRNLGKMTSIGLLKPLSSHAKVVADRLADDEHIRRSRMHPLAVLLALTTYRSGHGVKGSLSWSPVRTIIDALDAAFVKAFGNVAPTGKRILLAIDVSGSMGSATISGTHLTAREAASAMAMVTVRTELQYHVVAFTGSPIGNHGARAYGFGLHPGISPLEVDARMSLADVVRKTSDLPFGPTDCALPAIYAKENKLKVDAIQIYTDNETWFGDIHPTQALAEYRNFSGLPTKQVVVGMTSVGYSIADPNDALSMDVIGFDAAAPSVIADFIRGRSPSARVVDEE